MDIAALIAIAEKWGLEAVLSVLGFILIYLAKQIIKNGEKDEIRASGLHDKLKEFRDEIMGRIDGHEKRIALIELEYVKRYVKREDFFRENQGWRTEINRLSDLITKQFTDFMKSIIELWKEKK